MDMSFNRKSSRRLAQFLAGLMLFFQFAVAAHACMMQQSGLAYMREGVPTALREESGMDGGGCLAHCLAADQAGNSTADGMYLPAALPASPISGFTDQENIARSASFASALLSSNSSPPLQILFCSFQT